MQGKKLTQDLLSGKIALKEGKFVTEDTLSEGMQWDQTRDDLKQKFSAKVKSPKDVEKYSEVHALLEVPKGKLGDVGSYLSQKGFKAKDKAYLGKAGWNVSDIDAYDDGSTLVILEKSKGLIHIS